MSRSKFFSNRILPFEFELASSQALIHSIRHPFQLHDKRETEQDLQSQLCEISQLPNNLWNSIKFGGVCSSAKDYESTL